MPLIAFASALSQTASCLHMMLALATLCFLERPAISIAPLAKNRKLSLLQFLPSLTLRSYSLYLSPSSPTYTWRRLYRRPSRLRAPGTCMLARLCHFHRTASCAASSHPVAFRLEPRMNWVSLSDAVAWLAIWRCGWLRMLLHDSWPWH